MSNRQVSYLFTLPQTDIVAQDHDVKYDRGKEQQKDRGVFACRKRSKSKTNKTKQRTSKDLTKTMRCIFVVVLAFRGVDRPASYPLPDPFSFALPGNEKEVVIGNGPSPVPRFPNVQEPNIPWVICHCREGGFVCCTQTRRSIKCLGVGLAVLLRTPRFPWMLKIADCVYQ